MKGVIRIMVFGLSVMAMSVLARAEPPNPQKIVRDTADRVLAQVTERRAELDADPSLLYGLVKDTVLPHFDFTAMTRSAMGRFWRKASADQQTRLVNEFREMLVRTYATALLGYTGQTIEYLPVRRAAGATRVTVQTRVRNEGGPPIPIDYRLRWDEEQARWLVYDVVVDGVSLVTNYRSSFARLIREGATREPNPARRMQSGIEHLIEALAGKNAESSQKKDAA